MGKSSTSLKKNKHSSKTKASGRSKSKKHKSKKVRRREVSLSSSDYDDSKSMGTSLSSSSEDRSKRKRERSRTRKDVKIRKKRVRRRSYSSDSSEDSLYAKKRKKVKRKDKHDETKEKSRRKKKVKRETSVSSVSRGSRRDVQVGTDGNDNSEYESSRGRTERKEKDKRRSRGRSGSAKSGRYRARSCSPCSSPLDECTYEQAEDKYVSENKSRWIRSVITVAKEGDEFTELIGNETKEEIVDDLDYPCRSNDSNDGGTKRELDHHTHDEPEEELRAEDMTGDTNTDVNFTDPKHRDTSSLGVSAGTSESMKEETGDVSAANLNDVDLESILRQRALENLRKFRGQVQSTTKASEQKNRIVSQVKQPVTDNQELVQDKSNISNVAIATKLDKQTPVEVTSLPVGRRNSVANPRNNGRDLNLNKDLSGSVKIQMACSPEKVINADNQNKIVSESANTRTGNLDSTPSEPCHDSLQIRSSPKPTTVPGLPREKLVLAESLKNKGSNDNVKGIRGMPSAGDKPPTHGSTFKHNNLDKGQDDASDHTQFKSKQTSDSRETSNPQLPVSEADEERNAAKIAQSSIQNINSSGRDVDESSNAAGLLTGSSVENNSGKVLDGSNQSSQFEQKTMTVMRGGELVQVSYKVYIPKKTPALARRQLKR